MESLDGTALNWKPGVLTFILRPYTSKVAGRLGIENSEPQEYI